MASVSPSVTTPPMLSALILILLLFSPAVISDNSSSKDDDREECGESLLGLATCLGYVGGTTDAPTSDCCSGLKLVLKTKKKCLCEVIKDRDDPELGISINATRALGLPRVCNAPANISDCPAQLNLPPDSPEAQIFNQASNNSYGGGSSPLQAPIANAKPNPTTTPWSSAGTVVQMSNGGSRNGKGMPGLQVRTAGVAIMLLWAFRANLSI